MGAILKYASPLESVFCYKCGIQFAMPEEFNARLVRNPSIEFYCPAGHAQHYLGESYQAQLDRITRERDAARDARNQAQAQMTRAQTAARNLRRRAAAGVCPCCKRTFVALARHMKAKHPAYGGTPKATKAK